MLEKLKNMFAKPHHENLDAEIDIEELRFIKNVYSALDFYYARLGYEPFEIKYTPSPHISVRDYYTIYVAGIKCFSASARKIGYTKDGKKVQDMLISKMKQMVIDHKIDLEKSEAERLEKLKTALQSG